MIRIVAPHFVAGVEISNGRVSRAAPIVKYMMNWPEMKVFQYCVRKGWEAHEL